MVSNVLTPPFVRTRPERRRAASTAPPEADNHSQYLRGVESEVVSCIDRDPANRLLSEFHPGEKGVIVRVHPHDEARGALSVDELERRLLELGFVEGADVEVLHEGLFGQDPMAVRLDDMRVALRRRDAEDVFILLDPAQP